MNLMDSELAISCSAGVSKNADIRNLIPAEGRELEISPNAAPLLFQEAGVVLLPLVVLLHGAQARSLLCLAVLAWGTRGRDLIQDSAASVLVSEQLS